MPYSPNQWSKEVNGLKDVTGSLQWVLGALAIIVIVAICAHIYCIYAQRGIEKKLKQMEHLEQQLKKHYGRNRRRRRSRSRSRVSKKSKSRKQNKSKGKKKKSEARGKRHVAIDMNPPPVAVKVDQHCPIKEFIQKVDCLDQQKQASLSNSSEDIMKYFAQATVVFPKELKEDSTQRSDNSKESISGFPQKTSTSESSTANSSKPISESSSAPSYSLASSLVGTIRPGTVQKTNNTQSSAFSASTHSLVSALDSSIVGTSQTQESKTEGK